MMETASQDFGRLEFAGGRFESHGMPVAGLLELRRFELLIEDVAVALYRREHLHRERTPRGFRAGFDLRVTDFEPGCVEAVLVRPPSDGTKLGVAIDDYFDKSRKIVFDEIDYFRNNKTFSNGFPADARSRLAMFGRGLRDSETIGYAPYSGSEFARLDSELRNLLGEKTTSVPEFEDVVLMGQVTGLESEPHQVTVFLSDERRLVKGVYNDPAIWTSLHIYSGYQERAPLVSLSARVRMSSAGELESIDDIYMVELALPERLAIQIADIAGLKSGWLDGSGVAFDKETIDQAEKLAEVIGTSKFPRVNIFPRPSGAIQFEWVDEEFEIDIQPTGEISAFALSDERDGDGEREFSRNSDMSSVLSWMYGDRDV